MPPEPRPLRWGLAGYRRHDPRHPAHAWCSPCGADELFRDDFSGFPPGWLTRPVGQLNAAIQEYHNPLDIANGHHYDYPVKKEASQ